jgi:hypothetical protein
MSSFEWFAAWARAHFSVKLWFRAESLGVLLAPRHFRQWRIGRLPKRGFQWRAIHAMAFATFLDPPM